MKLQSLLHESHQNRTFWRLQIGGWIGIQLFSYLIALINGRDWDNWRYTLPAYLTGFLGTLWLRLLLRRWRQLSPLQLAAAMVLPCLAVGALMSVALEVSWALTCIKDCSELTLRSLFGAVVGYTYLILAWAFLYITLRFYRELQRQTRQALEAKAMAHQAQLKMLRYQLNPHFLFNTLNAISTLVLDRKTEVANQMVEGLSRFLRYTLDNDPVQRVTLGQELEAITLYLDIEKLRFDHRLRMRIDVDPACRAALLPSLLLQPLVENAIKHAVAGRVAGGTIEISAQCSGEQLEVIVADDGPGCGPSGPDPAGAGHGVGLANARERLHALYQDEQDFFAGNRPSGGFEVRLRLPFEAESTDEPMPGPTGQRR